jgi:hypothetical protein
LAPPYQVVNAVAEIDWRRARYINIEELINIPTGLSGGGEERIASVVELASVRIGGGEMLWNTSWETKNYRGTRWGDSVAVGVGHVAHGADLAGHADVREAVWAHVHVGLERQNHVGVQHDLVEIEEVESIRVYKWSGGQSAVHN